MKFITPMGTWVFVAMESVEKTAAGIFVPRGADTGAPPTGTVIEIGPDVSQGNRIAGLVEGAEIMFNVAANSGHYALKVDKDDEEGVEFILVPEDAIVAVVGTDDDFDDDEQPQVNLLGLANDEGDDDSEE